MKLLWTRRALVEIDEIFAYVAADSPIAAERLALLIEAKALLLINQPNMGRPGRVDGTREFVVTGTPYILPYRVRDGRVEILAVLHASRQWPDQL
ncbi:type II toxin-antitoxin system RelE/ParE family toxin [Bosea sp. (in: a-proteobacteria)]|uniref:Type II toxin-antitoxin system RelE/ParE family toxin n=1 Tax=Bosea vestrisii TaxID=151416 RepID=A0ABW0HGD7_9HYPH|nr:type II toxin-antitoxin system RelE/ParE family toxin [Bosea sp. (in: a-proteobacteria)]MBA4224492.1 type II toxin-antitoxin system mRNA interferase toxin, RelE/StbE family [Methylobacterium sp.]MBR3191749.1 type II toxin-antitoxin system RelE/ParE family toxin [Bosea sp. (in: a-proteobacteria)]